jgi:hypothetical protein
MELIITVLCVLALAALAAQLFNPLLSIPGLAQHLPYFGRPDSSAGSVPSVSSVPSDGYDPATMFRRMDSLTEASNAATVASRRLAEQGGVATSIEQQYLLQQPYN